MFNDNYDKHDNVIQTAITATHNVINGREVWWIPWVLAILTNCLSSCSSSLNFNVLEKGEIPTNPVSRAIPHFIVLCFRYNSERKGNKQRRKGKNAIWTLR